MKHLASHYGDQIVLGAGTCITGSQAQAAAQAGVVFLVSPHTEPALAKAMTATGLPTMMGALTPSEVMGALSLGSLIGTGDTYARYPRGVVLRNLYWRQGSPEAGWSYPVGRKVFCESM